MSQKAPVHKQHKTTSPKEGLIGQLREGRGLVGDDDALALVAEVDAEEELGAVVLEGGTRFGIERHFGREALLVHIYVHLLVDRVDIHADR